MVLVPEPVEAAVVVQIYESYVLRGMGLMAISETLNARGVPAPRGGVWTKPTLWSILRNPVYLGTLVHGKFRYSDIGKKRGKVRQPNPISTDQAMPAIVSRQLWDAAQQKHGTRKFGVGRPYHHPYLLSRLIICDHCGKRFRAHKQTRGSVPYYYICASYHDAGRVCAMVSAFRRPTSKRLS